MPPVVVFSIGSTPKSARLSLTAAITSLKVAAGKLVTSSPKHSSIACSEYDPGAPKYTTLVSALFGRKSSTLNPPSRGFWFNLYWSRLLTLIICLNTSLAACPLNSSRHISSTALSFSSSLALSNMGFPTLFLYSATSFATCILRSNRATISRSILSISALESFKSTMFFLRFKTLCYYSVSFPILQVGGGKKPPDMVEWEQRNNHFHKGGIYEKNNYLYFCAGAYYRRLHRPVTLF